MNLATTYPESLEREVRECLSHMYDFAAMQDDPLVQRLAPHLTGLERIQVVRKLLIDMIEQLNDFGAAAVSPGPPL